MKRDLCSPAVVCSWMLIFYFFVTAGPADADNWQWRHPLPQGNPLRSVCFGNGVFVAVGDMGTIVSSRDGLTWTKRHHSSTALLITVTYGNGLFLAGGYSDYGRVPLYHSPDGEQWREIKTVGGDVRHLTYGDGTFAAIIGGEHLHVSRDGTRWTATGIRHTNTNAVTFGKGVFVLAGSYGIVTASSSDGKRWVKRESNIKENTSLIAYGNDMFVAVVQGRTAVSADGLNWHFTGGDLPVEGLRFLNDRFVAVGGRLYSSVDGHQWTVRERKEAFMGDNTGLKDVAFGNGTYVAVGDGGRIFSSLDGAVWTPASPGARYHLTRVAYGGGRYAAVGKNAVFTSADGKTWDAHDLGGATGGTAIAYGNGTFVVVGGGCFLTSSDGTNWLKNETPQAWPLRDVAFNGHVFAAVGEEQNRGVVLLSTDGRTWRQGAVDIPAMLTTITAGKGTFVALGKQRDEGIAFVSQDGEHWTPHKLDPSCSGSPYSSAANPCQSPSFVTFGNGRFVALHYAEQYTSPDGRQWTKSIRERPFYLKYPGSLSFVNGEFLATNWYGLLYSSSDGVNWRKRSAAGVWHIYGAVYGPGGYVLVGPEGAILQASTLDKAEEKIKPLVEGKKGKYKTPRKMDTSL